MIRSSGVGFVYSEGYPAFFFRAILEFDDISWRKERGGVSLYSGF